MKGLLLRSHRLAIPVLAMAFLASASVLGPINASAETTAVDDVIGSHSYSAHRFILNVGQSIKVDLEVQFGPNLAFYLMNQTDYDKFAAIWSGASETISYVADMSDGNTRSFHKSGLAPSDGIFYYVIVNGSQDQSASVSGTIITSSGVTNFAFAVVVVVIVVVAIVIVVVVIAVVNSRRARAQQWQYMPPGQPAPQMRQSRTAPHPVVQQSLDATCARCGTRNSPGAEACSKCGTHLG